MFYRLVEVRGEWESNRACVTVGLEHKPAGLDWF
jgi:hypothetical protein